MLDKWAIDKMAYPKATRPRLSELRAIRKHLADTPA